VKIDMFAHVVPQKYIDSFEKNNERRISFSKVSGDALTLGYPVLSDPDKRLEVMARYEGYAQVLVPICEVLEPVMNAKDTARLKTIYNDSLSEWFDKYPDKYIGAAATIPLNDTDAALKEIERAITQLGFKGIVMHTPVIQYGEGAPVNQGVNFENIKPLDSPEFWPIYEAMSKYNLPIWIHPHGLTGVPVYKGEPRGKYMLFHIFGWPIETMMAMSRLVCSGVLAKYPNLRFITHHCGSMLVPGLASRIDEEFDRFVYSGELDWASLGQAETFKIRRPIEYFKMFYGDTALYGGTDGLECGFKFFGPEHIVFGTDFPMDMDKGTKFLDWTIEAVNRMRLSDGDRHLVYEGNAKQLLQIKS
jgi:predicted TIM-barrel fold metal-dependent hydrolase